MMVLDRHGDEVEQIIRVNGINEVIDPFQIYDFRNGSYAIVLRRTGLDNPQEHCGRQKCKGHQQDQPSLEGLESLVFFVFITLFDGQNIGKAGYV